MKKFMVLCCFFILGCSNYSKVAVKRLDIFSCNPIVSEKISICIKPFSNINEQQQYFGVNLQSKQILPIQVHIYNDSDYSIGLSDSSFVLFSGDDKGEVMNIDKIYNSNKQSGLSPILIPIFGSIIVETSINSASESNINFDTDIRSKIFKYGAIHKGELSDGIVFFYIPNSIKNIKEYELLINILSLKTKKYIPFTFKFK